LTPDRLGMASGLLLIVCARVVRVQTVLAQFLWLCCEIPVTRASPRPFVLSHPIASEFLDDVRIHGLRIGNVEVVSGDLDKRMFCQAAAIERGGQLRI